MNHRHKLLVLLVVVVSALALPQQAGRGSRRFQLSEELPSAPEEWRPERTLRRVDTEQPQATRRRSSPEQEAEFPSRRQAVPTQRRSSVAQNERSSRRISNRISASPAPEFETASSVLSAVREPVISSRTQRKSFTAVEEEKIAPRSSFSRRRDSVVPRVTSPSSSEFDTASSVLTPVKQQLVTEQAQRRASFREQEPEVIPRQISSRRREDTRGRSKTVVLDPEVRRSGSSNRRGGRRLAEGASGITSATPTTTATTSTTSTSVDNNLVTTTPTPIIANQTANDTDVAASILNSEAGHIIDNDIPEASAAPLQVSAAEAQGTVATDVLRSRAANSRQGAARSGSARRKLIGDADNEIIVRPRSGGNARRHPEGSNVTSRTRHEPSSDISRTVPHSEVDSQSNTQRIRPRSRGGARSNANNDQQSDTRNVRNQNRDTEHSRRASVEEETVKTNLPQQDINRVDKGRRTPIASRPERLNSNDRGVASVEADIPKRNRVRNELNRGQVSLGNDETDNTARNNRQSTAENFQRRNENSSPRSGIQTEITKPFRSRNRSSDGNRRYTEITNTGGEPESVTTSNRATVSRNKAAETGRGKLRQNGNGRRGTTTSTAESVDSQKADTEDRSQFPSRSRNKSDNRRYEPISDLKSSGRRKNKENEEEILPPATSDAESSDILEQLQLQDALKLKDENEAQEQEVQKKKTNSELEDSFITRSSHQVVTVTGFPNSVSDSQQKIATPPANKQRYFRPAENRRPGHNNKLRTASLSIAPTPASNGVENEGEDLAVQKVTVSVLEDQNGQRSRNNENNNVPNVPLHRFNARKSSSFNATRLKSARKHTEREELKAAPTTETKRQLSPPNSPVSQINPTVSNVGRSGIYFKQQHSQKATENLDNFSKTPNFVSTTSLPLTKVSAAETKVKPNEKLQELTQREPTSSTRKGAPLPTTSIPADTKKVATSYVSVVMSNGAPAKSPRFSARYRSELFRATGHGSRVTTTPVYVPTVPTVRASPPPTSSLTSHSSDPVLSETPSGALKVLDTSQQTESTVHVQAALNTTTSHFSTPSTTTEITTAQSVTKRKPKDIVVNTEATTIPSNDYKQNLTLPTNKKSVTQTNTLALTNKPTNTKTIPLPSRTFISASRRQSGPFVETADNINRSPAKQVEIIYKSGTTTSRSPGADDKPVLNPKQTNEKTEPATPPINKNTSNHTTDRADRAKPKAKPKRPNEDRWFPNLLDLFFPSSTKATPITIDLLDDAESNANRVVRARDVKSSTQSSTTVSTTTVDSFIQRIPPKSKANIITAEDNEIKQTLPLITTTSSSTTTPSTTTPTTTITTSTTTTVTTSTPSTIATPKPNIQIQTVTQALFVPPRIYTTTLRTPVPFVVFGIYPNGTIFRKLPNSNVKEIVSENEIGRKNPYYLDQDITTTSRPTRTTETPLALNVANNEILPAVRTTSTVTTPQLANTAADIQAQTNLPVELNTIVPYEPTAASTATTAALVPTQARNMSIGAMMAEALGLDASANLTEATMASFLASLARNSRINTAPITNTTSFDSTSTTTATVATTTNSPTTTRTVSTTTTTQKPSPMTSITPQTTTTTVTTAPSTIATTITTTTTTTTTPTMTTNQITSTTPMTTTTQQPVLTTAGSAPQKRAPTTTPITVTKKPSPSSTKKPIVPTTVTTTKKPIAPTTVTITKKPIAPTTVTTTKKPIAPTTVTTTKKLEPTTTKKPPTTTTKKPPPPTTTKQPVPVTVTNKSKPVTTTNKSIPSTTSKKADPSPIIQKAVAPTTPFTEKPAETISVAAASFKVASSSSKNTAAPKTTTRPPAGVLDEISFLNALFGQLQNSSPRPERDQGSSLANRIIQAALARGATTTTKPPVLKTKPTTIKPSTAQPSTTTSTSTTSGTTTTTPTTTTTTSTTTTTTPLPISITARSITSTVTSKPLTPKPANKATGAALQNAEELDALLKLLENSPPVTKNLSPSEQLLNDFLIKQATANVPAPNLRIPPGFQVSPSPSSKQKTAKRPKSIPRTTTQPPGQLLSQLFGSPPETNPGATQANRIRDPRAGQGLVEAAINATKVMSQIMGSVIRGAARSFQSLFRSLASSSG